MNELPRPCLCLVSDRRAVDPSARTDRQTLSALEAILDEAVDAGIDLIQIREPDLEARELSALVGRVLDRVRSSPTRVVVNDRADVAVSTGAHGVHLRSDGPAASRLRPWCGDGFLIGRSIHSASEASSAGSVDYLVFGTVFPTRSKPGGPTAGAAGLGSAVQASSVPVLAIGGVTPERVRECRNAGAAGIAAIGVFLPQGCTPESLGPRAAIRAFRQHWDAAESSSRAPSHPSTREPGIKFASDE